MILASYDKPEDQPFVMVTVMHQPQPVERDSLRGRDWPPVLCYIGRLVTQQPDLRVAYLRNARHLGSRGPRTVWHIATLKKPWCSCSPKVAGIRLSCVDQIILMESDESVWGAADQRDEGAADRAKRALARVIERRTNNCPACGPGECQPPCLSTELPEWP